VKAFTVDEYHWLIAHGFFALDERCELLDGLIVNAIGASIPLSVANAAVAPVAVADLLPPVAPTPPVLQP
jgi:hypothetical protein